MYINKIIKMKNSKYKIIIDDDSIITYDSVILDNDLLYKKNIDKNLYNKIINDTNYYDIYNKTVKYILKRRRSEKEINDYLNKFEISDNIKTSIINKLKDINLINDIDFCKAYINDKLYLSKYGINKIKNDLLNHNIPTDVIQNLLENIDNQIISNRLETIIIKKIKNNTKYSNYYLKQKILNEMISLGYNKEDIVSIIDRNVTNDNNILNKEYKKIEMSLSKKYSGYELNNKIKQKLLSKGFSLDDINLLIKNTED